MAFLFSPYFLSQLSFPYLELIDDPPSLLIHTEGLSSHTGW